MTSYKDYKNMKFIKLTLPSSWKNYYNKITQTTKKEKKPLPDLTKTFQFYFINCERFFLRKSKNPLTLQKLKMFPIIACQLSKERRIINSL